MLLAIAVAELACLGERNVLVLAVALEGRCWLLSRPVMCSHLSGCVSAFKIYILARNISVLVSGSGSVVKSFYSLCIVTVSSQQKVFLRPQSAMMRHTQSVLDFFTFD